MIGQGEVLTSSFFNGPSCLNTRLLFRRMDDNISLYMRDDKGGVRPWLKDG